MNEGNRFWLTKNLGQIVGVMSEFSGEGRDLIPDFKLYGRLQNWPDNPDLYYLEMADKSIIQFHFKSVMDIQSFHGYQHFRLQCFRFKQS